MYTDRISQKGLVLQDIRKSGKERPWRECKLGNLSLEGSYRRIGNMKKARRCKECSGYLEFVECPSGHERKLIRARFCQLRLCPMCSRRRSDLVFQNLREVIHTAKEREKFRFIFLTLTAKTVNSDQIRHELTKYFDAWNSFSRRRPFKARIVGWFRALEITHNWRKDSYHPHFHCLLAVRPSYFGKGYVKQATWAQWWKESMGLDYTPITDVRVVKPKKERIDEVSETGAILETAKYTVKSRDYLIPENQKAQDKAVKILDDALQNRRLIAYGGILKRIRKELKHVDEDKHNLVKTGEDKTEGCICSICQLIYEEVHYHWHVGYKEYIKVSRDDLMVSSNGKVVDCFTGEVF